MLLLKLSPADQHTVFAGLKNHGDVELDSSGHGGVFKHKSGLKAQFEGGKAGIEITVIDNPENVPEAAIQSRFEDDVKLLLAAAR